MERLMHPEAQLPSNIFIVRNPVATNPDEAYHHIHQLVGGGEGTAETILFETQDVSREHNRDLFTRSLERAWRGGFIVPDKTWLVVAGGDGTLGNIAEALVDADEELRALPILPIGVGNANDVAHGLHGKSGARYLSRHYHTTQFKKVRPLECTMQSASGGSRAHSALGYISFGASAYAAEAINKGRTDTPWKQLPGVRHMREAVRAFGALSRAGQFEVEEVDEHDIVQARRLTDRLFVNGRYMAKYLRFPVELAESTYFVTDVRARSAGTIALAGAAMTTGQQKGKVVQPFGEHVFTVLSETKLQVDGEVYDVPRDTTVAIAPVADHKALTFACVTP